MPIYLRGGGIAACRAQDNKSKIPPLARPSFKFARYRAGRDADAAAATAAAVCYSLSLYIYIYTYIIFIEKLASFLRKYGLSKKVNYSIRKYDFSFEIIIRSKKKERRGLIIGSPNMIFRSKT